MIAQIQRKHAVKLSSHSIVQLHTCIYSGILIGEGAVVLYRGMMTGEGRGREEREEDG